MSLPNTASLGAGSWERTNIFSGKKNSPTHNTPKEKKHTHTFPTLNENTHPCCRPRPVLTSCPGILDPSASHSADTSARRLELHAALMEMEVGWRGAVSGEEETVQSEAALMRRDGGQSAPAERERGDAALFNGDWLSSNRARALMMWWHLDENKHAY